MKPTANVFFTNFEETKEFLWFFSKKARAA